MTDAAPLVDLDRLALLASTTDRAREAAEALQGCMNWVPLDEATAVVVLGGDGFMLDALHQMLDDARVLPAYGLNLGTVGFLMNRHRGCDGLARRIAKARPITVCPLRMEAVTQDGERHSSCAINEVSLLRETRQTAKIEISVNGKVRVPELMGDGVLLATPVGSTAYNLSAHGPILPLDSQMLALTPISPFRPRRWRGAILPSKTAISFRVLDATRRPVSAVADQREVRDVAEISVAVDRTSPLTLMFDPEHTLDDRITMEQFAV